MKDEPRFRPVPPGKVKLQVVLNQRGRCGCGCGEYLEHIADIDFDHVPALRFRAYDPATRSYTPDANDPEYLKAKLRDCHKRKTFGPGGEKRITTRGSDIGEPAHERKVTASHEAFRQRMLARKEGREPPVTESPKRKSKIPSRPFPSRAAKTKETRS